MTWWHVFVTEIKPQLYITEPQLLLVLLKYSGWVKAKFVLYIALAILTILHKAKAREPGTAILSSMERL